ncbi:mechanosensitive ion channel family protein [Paremcibacter congregatus]|uniref:Small-conductance mechanosensitive channel n=1 Tax=Paremcibacter congregatus TaxID=2043170 RepID=A0A2G4YN63_9PROT|nr:mechanosensitive ion channel domain-containing protein [Paremcibacter congregatus]PHZ83750.1 mechanosensitive ion channel protein MscS [Paremcibacter congregatus]QDE27451.1 mechanosensitive ion channel [Paremcibacter congregatus]
MENEVAHYSELAMNLVMLHGMNVLGALLTLIIGWMIAGWARKAVSRMLGRSSRIDVTLTSFLSSAVRYIIIIFTLIAVLGKFGVETTSLVAILGAASLAIGLALQGTLGNVAAGVMLLIFRPFKIGDFIDAAGQSGTVKDLGLFVTELATPDNVQIIVPNGMVWGASIKNFSAHAIRRVDLLIGIGYNDNIDHAIQQIGSVIDADERALKSPEASIFVGELADSSVNIVVRVWTESANYWPLKAALTKNIKHKFDEKNISIPYPQQDLHVITMTK